MNVSVWNFMQSHSIDTIGDFASTVCDLNASFYTIKNERISTKKQIENLDNP